MKPRAQIFRFFRIESWNNNKNKTIPPLFDESLYCQSNRLCYNHREQPTYFLLGLTSVSVVFKKLRKKTAF